MKMMSLPNDVIDFREPAPLDAAICRELRQRAEKWLDSLEEPQRSVGMALYTDGASELGNAGRYSRTHKAHLRHMLRRLARVQLAGQFL
jgi:hypothetical protein